MGTCVHQGTHPSVVKLPASWHVNDEIYRFSDVRADNQFDLRCGSDLRPIAWHRDEGAGRIFYTALGHDVEWSDPVFVNDHLRAGILWTLGR
jgi:type 1 glutamine amidotransferase